MSQELTGKILADKYQIDEVLQENNLATVYRGTHLLMEKPVTIKVLSPGLAIDDNIVRQFSGEAKINSHISHPNILGITDFGSDADNLVYIVMESVDGEPLRTALDEKGTFETNRAIRIIRQTAAALSAAHSTSTIHGHLNPHNILLNRNLSGIETVKVSDFGSIISVDEEFTVEKARYVAPEQYADFSKTDERSDIYTLGIIFYEMLAGETPFTAETVTDLMLKKNDELPAPLSAFRNNVPPNIEPVILKALSKNPQARQQSAAQFVEELDRVFGYDADTVIVPAASSEPVNNNLWKTAFVVLAGISLLSVAFIYATQVKQTDPQTQLQTDANGMPVQPLSPATGMNEQGVNSMLPYQLPEYGDANTGAYPEVQQMPGGDGYDPWGRGGAPPIGSPVIPSGYPAGNYVYVPGDTGSVFMPNGDQVILVPKATDANTNTAPAPTKSPKETNANIKTAPTPNAPPDEVPTNTPKPNPKPSPAEKPKDTPPATTDKRPVSGKEQDSEQ